MNAYYRGERLFLTLSYGDKERAKRVPGYRWEGGKLWSWHRTREGAVRQLFDFEVEQTEYRVSGEVTVPGLVCVFTKDFSWYVPRVKSFKHQSVATSFLVTRLCYALFEEMGLGKTKSVIDAMSIFADFRGGSMRLAVVFCPKTLISVWCEEIEKYGTGILAFPVTWPTEKAAIKVLKLVNEAKGKKEMTVLIVGYDKGKRLISANPGIFNDVEMVVLDESQKIKTHNTSRTKAILSAFSRRKNIRKVIMSGTPITQNCLDLWPQFNFLDPEITQQRSFYGFRNRYAVMQDFRNFKKVIGFQNLEELKALIKPHCYELRKDQVDDLTFPERLYQKRILEMKPEMKRQYKEMRDNLLIELQGMPDVTANIILTKILRLQQVTAGTFLECQQDNLKVEEIRDLLQGELIGKKVIVWCRFLESIKLVESMARQEGRKPVVLTGATKNRGEIIEQFQTGDADVFIGQMDTGGVGITLTASDVVIFYENDFKMANRKQCEDRIHRIGQKSPNVTYIDLVYKGTIDEKVLRVLDAKGDFATEIVASFLKGEWAV